jgi:hypothetical protein
MSILITTTTGTTTINPSKGPPNAVRTDHPAQRV